MDWLRIPRLGLLPRRVAIEQRPGELLWAESVWRPSGPKLRAMGRETAREGEKADELLKRFADQAWLSGAELAVALRHPELQVQRLELPALSEADARRVASRRARELADEALEPATFGCLLAHGKRARPAWLVACPEQFASFAEKRWRNQGVAFAHFGSMHLALATLTRLLEPPAEGELRAFLDMGSDHAVCVLADAEGWVFSREISIKLTRGAGGGADPVERLATELRRTFHYVDVELRAGQVSGLILSGARDGLDALAEAVGQQLEVAVELIGDAVAEGSVSGADPALATVAGLALTTRTGGANLLPPDARREASRRMTRRRLIVGAAVSALLVVLSAGQLGLRLAELSELRSTLEQDWREQAAVRRQTETHREAQDRADAVASAAARLWPLKPTWSSAIGTLGLLLPDDAFVSGVVGAREEDIWYTRIELEFRGDDLASAAESGSRFAEMLDASPLWTVEDVSRADAPRRAEIFPTSAVRAHFHLEALLASIRELASGSGPQPGSEAPRG